MLVEILQVLLFGGLNKLPKLSDIDPELRDLILRRKASFCLGWRETRYARTCRVSKILL